MKETAEKARALDAGEIAKQIKDTAEQMFRLRFQMSMGQMDGVKKVRSMRKERARMRSNKLVHAGMRSLPLRAVPKSSTSSTRSCGASRVIFTTRLR